MRILSLRRRDVLCEVVACYCVLAGVVGILAGSPFLSRLRAQLPLIVGVGLVAVAFALVHRIDDMRRAVGLVLAAVVCVAGAVHTESAIIAQKRRVMMASPQAVEPVSRHMLLGYRDPREMRALLERFDFAGVFVTAHNARGKTASELAAEIASFQEIQKEKGRAPLLVATDQEGGAVSRLSGPLPLRGALATFEHAPLREVAAHAEATALDLASLGVNVNFAPVVDLRFGDGSVFDRNSRIDLRAASADPDTVAAIATTYTEAMHDKGVLPVAKHFPGLGRLDADTHVNDARLDVPVSRLLESDWVPYRALSRTGAHAVMVGHAIASDVDAENPSSISRAVVGGTLRGALAHKGLVFSDDMCMSPTYRRGVSRSVDMALTAGVDVVLVTYDAAVVYEVLDALAGRAREVESDLRLDAFRRGQMMPGQSLPTASNRASISSRS